MFFFCIFACDKSHSCNDKLLIAILIVIIVEVFFNFEQTHTHINTHTQALLCDMQFGIIVIAFLLHKSLNCLVVFGFCAIEPKILNKII